MITEIQIKNCRSIVDAVVNLSPFTLLIGANGTGKSNFLDVLAHLSNRPKSTNEWLPKHVNYPNENQLMLIKNEHNQEFGLTQRGSRRSEIGHLILECNIRMYSIEDNLVGGVENITENPIVRENGSGTVQVLDSLKTGDKEYLFDEIEKALQRYIPEIEKLSFKPTKTGKFLQVREKHIQHPIPLSQLSEGTRLILAMLTIVNQVSPPRVLCFEEIDHGLHPRLFQKIIQLFFDITREKDIQIIATTHSPYLLDEFKDHEEAVIIVEKENGETKFTTLAEKMKFFEDEDLSDDRLPLGELWYGGFVGGVPVRG